MSQFSTLKIYHSHRKIFVWVGCLGQGILWRKIGLAFYVWINLKPDVHISCYNIFLKYVLIPGPINCITKLHILKVLVKRISTFFKRQQYNVFKNPVYHKPDPGCVHVLLSAMVLLRPLLPLICLIDNLPSFWQWKFFSTYLYSFTIQYI